MRRRCAAGRLILGPGTKVPLWKLRRAREEDLKIFGRTGAGDSSGAGSTFQPGAAFPGTFVGGYANALSWTSHHEQGESRTRWVRDRAMRVLWPTGVYVIVAVLAITAARLAAVSLAEIAKAGSLVALQLWFLPVYLLLVALTLVMLAAHRRGRVVTAHAGDPAHILPPFPGIAGHGASRAPCPDLWPFSSRCCGVMVVASRRRRDGNARSCRR